jgi:hypothetical protein
MSISALARSEFFLLQPCGSRLAFITTSARKPRPPDNKSLIELSAYRAEFPGSFAPRPAGLGSQSSEDELFGVSGGQARSRAYSRIGRLSID